MGEDQNEQEGKGSQSGKRSKKSLKGDAYIEGIVAGGQPDDEKKQESESGEAEGRSMADAELDDQEDEHHADPEYETPMSRGSQSSCASFSANYSEAPMSYNATQTEDFQSTNSLSSYKGQSSFNSLEKICMENPGQLHEIRQNYIADMC